MSLVRICEERGGSFFSLAVGGGGGGCRGEFEGGEASLNIAVRT